MIGSNIQSRRKMVGLTQEQLAERLGVSRDDLPAVAKQARYDGAALYNETEITLEDAMAVLEAAY